MNQKIGPDHYRYYSDLGPGGVSIHCETFTVVGETERCYYVLSERYSYIHAFPDAERLTKKYRKRVLKDSRIRLCYPDRRDALVSFRLRQQHRQRHLQRQQSVTNLALDEAIRLLQLNQLPNERSTSGHGCGHDEYTRSLSWGDC
ncbi:hypothetical protein PSGK_19045 [Pseudomonas solani]|uniref:hypothetical protein n=1 Tax=Pseudomonas solani TaxID=2731552 RepID=UPI0035BE555E